MKEKEMVMIHDENGECKEYIESLLKKFQEGKLSFNKLVKEIKDVESFAEDTLLDNIELFKGKIKYNILSRAILDGGVFYSPETTERYLKEGLSRNVLIKWLKQHLPYDYGICDGAEDEDLDFDFVVLELCQLLRKYDFSVGRVESVLRALSEDARVFFLMNTTQREEWIKIGINPKKFKDRCLKYPVENYKVRLSPYDFKEVPIDLRGILFRRIWDFSVFKTQDYMEMDESMGDVVDFLTKCGISKIDLAKKFIKDIGTEYDQYTRKEIGYAINLLPEANETIDAEKVLDSDKIWDLWKKAQPRREFDVWDFVEAYYEDSYW